MDSKTAKALEESIEHWKQNLAAQNPENASTSSFLCKLCENFLYNNCEGCPVFNKTGQPGCSDTPYQNASNLLWTWRDEDIKYHMELKRVTKKTILKKRAAFRKAAREEIKFLESLREVNNV